VVLNSIFSKETTVGVDIGSSCIKAIEIEPTSRGWELANAAIAPTPKDVIKDGVVVNVGEVSQVIKDALRGAGIKATGRHLRCFRTPGDRPPGSIPQNAGVGAQEVDQVRSH